VRREVRLAESAVKLNSVIPSRIDAAKAVLINDFMLLL